VRQHAAGLLAPFKVPRYMEATAELPHTPTGRVAKHELTRERTPDEIDFERRA
jgi:non-ribosomal peptide synthetase component E (peptide arylation enzyme)